jgi:hypothetical protein
MKNDSENSSYVAPVLNMENAPSENIVSALFMLIFFQAVQMKN